jgi:hypothetical protein
MSSTGDAPCRNEKLVWLWSSAYVADISPGWLSGTEGADHYRTNVLSERAQHNPGASRLTGVEIDVRSVAVVLTRTTASLLLAGLLILVLLPAALAASSR